MYLELNIEDGHLVVTLEMRPDDGNTFGECATARIKLSVLAEAIDKSRASKTEPAK